MNTHHEFKRFSQVSRRLRVLRPSTFFSCRVDSGGWMLVRFENSRLKINFLHKTKRYTNLALISHCISRFPPFHLFFETTKEESFSGRIFFSNSHNAICIRICILHSDFGSNTSNNFLPCDTHLPEILPYHIPSRRH